MKGMNVWKSFIGLTPLEVHRNTGINLKHIEKKRIYVFKGESELWQMKDN